MQFFYIYKPLAHPELNNYVSPFSIEERLMHVAEAKRRLGTSVSWLADTMDNAYHEAVGRTPNSELVLDADGIVVARACLERSRGAAGRHGASGGRGGGAHGHRRS